MKNSVFDTSSTSIAELVRLREAGEITNEEFAVLKGKVVSGAETGKPVTVPEQNAQYRPPGLGLTIVAALIAGLIYADHVNGSIFPDDWYCVVGTGTPLQQAGQTKATSWSVNNGCNASRPECVTEWSHTPATARCLHGTLWDAIRTKFRGILA